MMELVEQIILLVVVAVLVVLGLPGQKTKLVALREMVVRQHQVQYQVQR